MSYLYSSCYINGDMIANLTHPSTGKEWVCNRYPNTYVSFLFVGVTVHVQLLSYVFLRDGSGMHGESGMRSSHDNARYFTLLCDKAVALSSLGSLLARLNERAWSFQVGTSSRSTRSTGRSALGEGVWSIVQLVLKSLVVA